MDKKSNLRKILSGTSARKKYNSIDEFTSLQEFPQTKPLILIDSNLNVVFHNISAHETFGVKAGGSISEIKSVPKLDVIIENMLEKGFLSFHFDMFFDVFTKRKDSYFVEIDLVSISNQEFFVLLFSSLEERHKIEERINSLHNALEFGNVPVVIINKDLRVSYSTTSFESILGLDISQIYNQQLTDVLQKVITKKETEELKKALTELSVWSAIIELEKGKTSKWYELLLKPVSLTNSVNTGYILTINDITRYIEARHEIQKSERRQRAIISNISEPILILREEGEALIIEGVNSSFCAEFNVDAVNLIETDFSACTYLDLVDVIYTAVDRLTSDDGNTMKFRYSNKETGKEYLCKFSILSYEHFQDRTFIISFIDITSQLENERRLKEAYEKEYRLNKLKSTFLANMSHEIRTPLIAVSGYYNLLKMELEEFKDDSITEIITNMGEGVARLQRLADNIVDLSLIEAGEIKPNYKAFNFSELFDELLEELRPFYEIKSVKVSYSVDEACKFIESDFNLLKKILKEIIDNAIKYNFENGRVEIRCYMFATDLRIEIIDTGAGIAPEMLKEIFNPFSQEELDGYKRNFEGAGLGLTIANKLTTVLHGKLELSSEVAKGTEVKLSFPITPPEIG
jgi:signal transduction histidine kinase